MRKTRVDIIDETVKFYSENPRAMRAKQLPSEPDSCAYVAPNGERCAFARCCTEDGVRWLHANLEGSNVQGIETRDKNLNEMLKPEYRGHDLHFWINIQRLHDSSEFWGQDGKLTPVGNSRVQRLKCKYAEEV